MTPIRSDSATRPYTNDAEYLEHLALGVKARAYHLGAVIKARRDAEDDPDVGLTVVGTNKANGGRLARLAAIDERVWAEIDARRKATREAGVILGLDALCNEHDLDEVERGTLILAIIPCLGLDLFDMLGEVASFSFALMSITPEMVAQFAGLDLAARVELIDRLGPTGRLVQAGLVEVDHRDGERLQEFWSSGIFLTESAFGRITGCESRRAEGADQSAGRVLH